jgi:hypothetical protein
MNGMALKESLDKYCKRTSAAAGELKRCESSRWDLHLGQMVDIIKAFVRNSLEYGLAIMPLTLKHKNELDKTLAKAIAEVLGLKNLGCAATLLHELGVESYEIRHPRLVIATLEKWRLFQMEIVPKMLVKDAIKEKSKGSRMKKLMRTLPFRYEDYVKGYETYISQKEQDDSKAGFFEQVQTDYELKQGAKLVTFMKPRHYRDGINPLYKFLSKNNQRALLRWRIGGYWGKAKVARACQTCQRAISRAHLYKCADVEALISSYFRDDYAFPSALGGPWKEDEKVAFEPIMFAANMKQGRNWTEERCKEYFERYDKFFIETFRRFNARLFVDNPI